MLETPLSLSTRSLIFSAGNGASQKKLWSSASSAEGLCSGHNDNIWSIRANAWSFCCVVNAK